MRKLAIIGASGHGKVAADIALCLGYEDVCFLDDAKGLTECAGLPVVGCSDDYANMPKDTEFFVAIGEAEVRGRVLANLRIKGCSVATLIHPRSYISRRVDIGEGTIIMAGAVVNSDTTIGCGCIVNTGATVDHDCAIGDLAHISVGSHIAGTVNVGSKTWVGAGAIVSNNINICENCMLGAGAVVVSDIKVPGTYVGVPAHLLERHGNQ